MIPQKPIKSYLNIAQRIMNHIWGKQKNSLYLFSPGWDNNSPAHMFWKRWAKRNFIKLRKLQWNKIYKLAREKK